MLEDSVRELNKLCHEIALFPITFRSKIIRLLPLSLLMRSQIRGVILDFDNTIVSEDDRYLSPGAEE
ncbi:MAG: hypothetical protein ACYTXC_17790 [Nostoc sp.]